MGVPYGYDDTIVIPNVPPFHPHVPMWLLMTQSPRMFQGTVLESHKQLLGIVRRKCAEGGCLMDGCKSRSRRPCIEMGLLDPLLVLATPLHGPSGRMFPPISAATSSLVSIVNGCGSLRAHCDKSCPRPIPWAGEGCHAVYRGAQRLLWVMRATTGCHHTLSCRRTCSGSPPSYVRYEFCNTCTSIRGPMLPCAFMRSKQKVSVVT